MCICCLNRVFIQRTNTFWWTLCQLLNKLKTHKRCLLYVKGLLTFVRIKFFISPKFN